MRRFGIHGRVQDLFGVKVFLGRKLRISISYKSHYTPYLNEACLKLLCINLPEITMHKGI
jgi:hypothetical protein